MAMNRKMTAQSVKGIMNKRILIPEQATGKRTVLTIQGDGTVIDVKDRNGDFVPSIADPNLALQKKIFNFRANSGLAMSSDRNKQILREAIAAEKAGDMDKAHELYNDFLNKVQFSAGILLPSAIAEKLSAGVEIAATVTKVVTDKGSILTIDPSTISIVEPERYGATSFSMDDFLEADEAEEENTETVTDVLTGLDRKELIAKAKELKVKGLTKTATDEQIKAAIREVLVEEEL